MKYQCYFKCEKYTYIEESTRIRKILKYKWHGHFGLGIWNPIFFRVIVFYFIWNSQVWTNPCSHTIENYETGLYFSNVLSHKLCKRFIPWITMLFFRTYAWMVMKVPRAVSVSLVDNALWNHTWQLCTIWMCPDSTFDWCPFSKFRFQLENGSWMSHQPISDIIHSNGPDGDVVSN